VVTHCSTGTAGRSAVHQQVWTADCCIAWLTFLSFFFKMVDAQFTLAPVNVQFTLAPVNVQFTLVPVWQYRYSYILALISALNGNVC
jgi:hypothetical protein